MATSEKNSLAKDEIVSAIKSAKTAVVVAHVNPDGDTLGSMLAIARVLEQAGVERVDRVMHDQTPEVYKFFPDAEKVLCSYDAEDRKKMLGDYVLNAEGKLEISPDSTEKYDLSFSCDCGSIDRLGSAGVVWANAKCSGNIDHHLSNTLFADLNWVDPDATSTGQVVNQVVDALNENGSKTVIDKELANLMYITLLTDTAGFRHSNTNAAALDWGRKLIELGAEPSDLYNLLFNQMPLPAIRVIGDALSKIEMFELTNAGKKIKIAYTYTTRKLLDEEAADDEDTDEIVDQVMRIQNADMCLYLREGKKDGVHKGSLRSSTVGKKADELIDCAAIAKQINGGGHARAAGFNVDGFSGFEELRAKVFSLIEAL